eukprot:Pompholyxophrys_punicea_v1_NODE_533_length_1737_cov_21.450059.p2 type:complete len:120 gc:universal NODE_533_length_1737_cov_21.450059:390-749(+)
MSKFQKNSLSNSLKLSQILKANLSSKSNWKKYFKKPTQKTSSRQMEVFCVLCGNKMLSEIRFWRIFRKIRNGTGMGLHTHGVLPHIEYVCQFFCAQRQHMRHLNLFQSSLCLAQRAFKI